jgi:hypothetical protein
MKEKELRERVTCSGCGDKFTKNGPVFYTVRVERYMLDNGAINRQQGLAMMMGGNGLLASVMGPDENMAHKIGEWDLTFCSECSVPLLIAVENVENSEEKSSKEMG